MPTPSTVSGANTSPSRSITTGNQVGLYWTGSFVNYSTCTGVSRNPINGSVGDFTGSGDSGSNAALWPRLPAPRAQSDVNLTEPTASNYHTYTITCGIQGGSGTISDSVTINNGAVITNLVILNPRVNDINVTPGATSVTIPFGIRNSGPNPTTAYTTTLSINGTSFGSQGPYTSTVASGATASHSRAVSWSAPNTTSNVPYQICVQKSPEQTTPSCASALLRVSVLPPPPIYQCSDTIDNDGDGRTDYPTDPGCLSPVDDDETNSGPSYQCSDGVDNDGDSLIDYPNDPGCTGPTDNNEANTIVVVDPPIYVCDDNLDNDNDGRTDHPNDPGCTGPTDNDETNPQCSDTTDNDGDGYIDALDPGCTNGTDNDESNNARPTITANPTIIRQGGSTTISWNPMGYTGCTLSPAMHFSGANAGAAGTRPVTLTTETTFVITCGNVSESVRVQIVPNIFET